MWTLDRLIEELKRIQKLGFVQTTHPHQGGVGNTLETLLGIKENNLRLPDLGEIELKAKRIGSESMLTLSSKSPLPKSVNKTLFNAYKTKGEDDVLRLYTTVPGSKRNNKGFRVKIIGNKLILENNQNIKAYWVIEKLDDVLKIGSQKIVLVLARTKGKLGSKNEKFNYTEAYLLNGLNFEKLKQSIKNDKLKIDIRIGADIKGKAAGEYHDHGTGFRIFKRDYLQLFDKSTKIL